MNVIQAHQNRTPLALQRCKSFTFDVNQQAESLVQWEQRYNQHSSGAFSGYLDELKLGGIHLFEEFTSQTLMQQCCVNDNSIWLGFSLQPQRPKINSNEIAAGQLMIRPSGVEFELMTPKDFHIFGLVLDRDAILAEMTGLDSDLWLNNANKILVSEANNYVSYELAKLIQLLLNNNSQGSLQNSLLNSDNSARLTRLKPLIASKIADLLAQTESGLKEVRVLRPTRHRVITAIRRHIEQTGHYPLTVTELCNIAHVSRRTLHYCFQEQLGVSPIQYIRDCRLNEIRRILLKNESKLSISELALELGFFHTGTFNAHYKQLFAETPGQTRARAANYQNATIQER